MKVKLEGYDLLQLAITSEGDTLVEKDEELLLDESAEGIVPSVAMQVLGYILKPEKEFFMITKRFSSGWNKQTYISFPLPTLMNNDLGYVFEAGRVGRYIPDNPCKEIFNTLESLFNEMKYKGFVSIKMSRNMEIVSVLFGAGLSLYAILEGSKQKISDFMLNGEDVLESWSASIVVSRYPFPLQTTAKRLFLNLTTSAMKHLWFYDLNVFKKSAYTDASKVCLVTAWATSLHEVAKRIYRTCNGLDIPQKQHRTDITPYITKAWTDFLCRVRQE